MYENTIREIRKQCRLAMNGVVSASMREKGISYKLNFGLTIGQIREIAKLYEPDSLLAESLWKEDVRELKILATMLFPVTVFSKEIADKWAGEVSNQEIREQLCLNLLQNVPFATLLVDEWSKEANTGVRTTGYWLMARLFLSRKVEKFDFDAFPHIWDDAVSGELFLRNAAQLALRHLGRQSQHIAAHILQKLALYENDPDPVKQEVYNSLSFEFDYYFSK